MSTPNPASQPTTKKSLWRTLRPLLLWALVILGLVGYRTHQVMLEKSRLQFSFTLAHQTLPYVATVTLDGLPAMNGQHLSLGHHTLTVTHPKVETFTTNFFGWYGGLDCGTIDLKRAQGSLTVAAHPPAQTITITGPEFSLTLNDSTGTNILVPTDTYRVSAQYARWSDAKDVVVTSAYALPCSFTPQLGALSLTCNQPGATFVVRDNNGQTVGNGDVPATLTGLPADIYQMVVTFHQHELQKPLFVAPNKTNDAPFEFVFGSTLVLSTPAGASVYNANGNYLGVTPLLVTELLPGNTEFKLQLYSHQDALVPSLVVADQTNTVSTNLLSWAYLNGLQAARHDIELGNFRAALNDVATALSERPGDADALALQAQAKARLPVQTAKELADQGDYVGADKILSAALITLPDDSEIKKLLADYQPHEAGQLTQMMEKKTRALFDAECQKMSIAPLFDTHEFLTTKKSPDDFKNELVRLYTDEQPKAKVAIDRSPEPGLHQLFFVQSSPNPLELARREMLVVIGKGKDDQTLVLFKNFEYQRRLTDNSADILLNANNPDFWLPLHPSRIQMTPAFEEQIKVGYRMMMRKVMKAVGETFVYTPN
jgi:PEGA domain